jgi:hypothetical protein
MTEILRQLRMQQAALDTAIDGDCAQLDRHELDDLITELDRLYTQVALLKQELAQVPPPNTEDSQLLDWLETAHAESWAAKAIDLNGKELKPVQWVHGIRHGARATARMSLREAIRDAMMLTGEVRP